MTATSDDRPDAADLEIERKYLLSGTPPEALGHPAIVVEQGYIPGRKLKERLRKSVFADGSVRYYRTVKLGSGLVRTEIEEETDERVFAHLWVLTEGRRIRKTRYVVPHADFTWEIDVFTDRELALAEVELPDEHAVAPIPPWLAPFLVKEVTGDKTYTNASLAR